MKPASIDDLLAIMAKLRDPDGGCPWDLEQDFASIVPYTVEEAYEVADAIDRRDMADLKDELGDLLFQVVFHAQMAQEAGYFAFDDVVAAICDKMLRRHPHVFRNPETGELSRIEDADAQTSAWDAQKKREREASSDAAHWPASRAACPNGSARPNCRSAPRHSVSIGLAPIL